MADTTLENLLQEDRTFPPSDAFRNQANAGPEVYVDAEHWKDWWLQQARDRISWYTKPVQGLDESNPPFYKWFADGELNLSYNCLDRHLDTIGDQVAYHFVGEPGDTRDLTFRDLYEDVGRFANALKSLGVERGDRVAIYLGMIPELPIAMLACARIGAVHSVVFGGFSADSLGDRRVERALDLALNLEGPGYHAFVCGLEGPRRLERVAALASPMLRREGPLSDWVYVNNFQDASRPRALRLSAGNGRRL